MADKEPPACKKLPIPILPTTAYTTKTCKQKKTNEEKHAKKKELDRARDKTRANLGAAFQRWRALRDLKGFRSDAELATFLLDRFAKGGFLANTSCAASRIELTLTDESTDSDFERRDYASDVGDDSELPQNGQTAPTEIELELTSSMTSKPSAALQANRKDFSMRSSSTPDEEENSDISESSYVNLNKEVLVLLMFRCLECSSECSVQGKGKGGNLSLRQECLICSNCRVWTAQTVQMPKDKVPDVHLTNVKCDDLLNPEQKAQETSLLTQTHQDRTSVNAVQEEAGARSEITTFVVKEEIECDRENEAGSLLMETYEDTLPISSVKKEDSVDEAGFNGASANNETAEPSHICLTDQKEEFPDEDVESDQADDSEDDSESLSSSYEPMDSSDEDFSETESSKTKVFQNTIKPVVWCEDCGAVANMHCGLRRHQKIYGCAHCGAEDSVQSCSFSVHFSDIHSFHKHAMDVHGATEHFYERTICQDCNKTYRVHTDPNKKGHVCENKTKPFSCHLCRKRFATKIGQKVHYRRLHGDYTHICKYCMMVFNTKMSKLEHEQTHSKDELTYNCPDCPEKFKDFISRNQHLKSHRGRKKYVCHTCNRTFVSLQRYERHMRIHSGEKPYKCGVCERSFNQAGHLKSHMRLHTGEKPFMCEQCGECFNHNVSLRNHLQRHHGSDSTSVPVEENKHKGRPAKNSANKDQRKKRARKRSSKAAATEELEVELELEEEEDEEEEDNVQPDPDLDYWEETEESDADEEKEKRGRKRKARRKKQGRRQKCTVDNDH
ncbi:zinc finger protein 470-like isoform X2 [Colossoma macropomum]|uniref:zinc finger protein 470-like isoform X2 n=1 Tax=Colossoma macropomum TaxID=42526 RepID=UPI0018653346|nr:zinc finger protein 470-like isoform X2 [Colossoma macropomum]XP_036452702.1 zinc finger protein 470-like isoform X2 [Colossoma macropomum]XP_036452703.1 zinc finger protein 470-like isoform X2 [Colossoma macropomum]XP_036452704.1 zinc finger protein 470-like isoform X2 [Colossoma macropomum]